MNAAQLAGLFAVVACAASAACSSTSGSPLGGPYGGGSFRIGPTDAGNVNTIDATYTPPSPPPSAAEGLPGTWTHIFSAYMAKGTIGNCTPCHHEMSDAPKSYKWLKDQDYVGGSHPALTSGGTSCLSWYGGDMPPGAQPERPEAVMEMDMWSDAGGKNN